MKHVSSFGVFFAMEELHVRKLKIDFFFSRKKNISLGEPKVNIYFVLLALWIPKEVANKKLVYLNTRNRGIITDLEVPGILKFYQPTQDIRTLV